MWEQEPQPPEMGDGAQAVINRQLVDNADILVGTFWTRLGTPTSEAESGTAEEIQRFLDAGKPVILYFSDEPVALQSIDREQYDRLLAFKEAMSTQGFVDSYSNLDELRWKALKALTRTIREHFGADEVPATDDAEPDGSGSPRPLAKLIARIDRQREISRHRGLRSSPRLTATRQRLHVGNAGEGPAENLTLRIRTARGR